MPDGTRPDLRMATDPISAFDAAVRPVLIELAQRHPEQLRLALDSIRQRLDGIELLFPVSPTSPKSAPAPVNGALTSQPAEGPDDMDDAADGLDNLGRNQRAKMREIALLEFLAGEGRPCVIQQVVQALKTRGFEDKQAAIVSHLHRLKDVKVVDVLGTGMYSVTVAGREHLHMLKTTYGQLFKS